MKKSVLLCAVLLATIAFPAFGTTHRVQVKQAALYQNPTVFARIVHVVKFSTPVTILEESGSFYQVRTEGRTGYIHSSAIVPQNVYIERYETGEEADDISYSPQAITAATRGFTTSELDQRKTLGDKARFDLMEEATGFYTFDKTAAMWHQFRRDGLLGEYRVMTRNQHHRR